MKVLGIETSGSVGSAAINDDDTALCEKSFEREHGRMLVPTIKELLKKSNLELSDIDIVAVSTGPGSFTGIRIGVTCAKTLSFATGKKVVPVSSLYIIAHNAPNDHEYVCPIIDAYRGKLYSALYRREADDLQTVYPDGVFSPEELSEKLNEGTFIFGNAVNKYSGFFDKPKFTVGDESLTIGKASVCARLGYKIYQRGGGKDFSAIRPTYLRRSEAEEKKLEREGKGKDA